jgi:hypothetical protein
MGNCGYALSDDETSLFYNPAGLGLKNERWNGGAFYLSSLHFDVGTGNTYYGIVYQNERLPRLGFSFNLNQFGSTENPYENAASIGGGFNFYSNDFESSAIGVAIKYYSFYDAGYGWKYESHTNPVAIDAGYLMQIFDRFRIGFSLKNMGPDLSNSFNDTINTRTTKQKLPFVIGAGLGYKDAFDFENLRVLDLCSGFSFEGVNEYYGGKMDNSIQTGIDLQFFRIFSVQFGYSIDLTYKANEVSWGTGFSLFNHFEFNFAWAKYTTPYDEFMNTGFSTAFKRILKWSGKDRRWWLD